MNKAIIIGRLGLDPTANKTQTGITVVNLSIATNEPYTDQGGNKVEKTEWHKVVVFGKQAEFCSNYLSKGRLVMVEGSIQTRKWQDQQGQNRYTTEIKAQRVQVLDSRNVHPKEEGMPPCDDYSRNKYTGDVQGAFINSKSDMDDLPF